MDAGMCLTAQDWNQISVNKYPVNEPLKMIKTVLIFRKPKVSIRLAIAMKIVLQSEIVSLPICRQIAIIMAIDATFTAS